ncbi:MAG: hypothetical protein C4337_10665 [Armatimonadota bacterium]
MPYEYGLHSPEKVEIRYEIAGIGSRALATVLDDLIVLVGVSMMVVFLALLEDTLQVIAGAVNRFGEPVSIILFLFLAYVLWFAYYIGFEILWNGQTPGKRSLGLRVLMLDGTPVTPYAIFVRELVRIVDAVPLCIFGYNVAGLLAFLNPYGQRLGDMLAGTFVVKERRTALPTLNTLSQLNTQPHPLENLLPLVLEVSPNEYRALRAFLDRRDLLLPEFRTLRAQELYHHFAEKLGLNLPPEIPKEGILEAIAARYARERLE